MESGYYKIIGKRGGGCKIFFTDRRTDKFRYEIQEIFNMMNVIDGSYIPRPEDFINGKYIEIIEQIENIKRKIDDCSHKAMAARFSLALIKQEVLCNPSANDMENYSQMIASKMCNKAELKNDILIYETEAFLFQVRTNIDIIVQLLKYISIYDYLKNSNKNNDKESFIFDNRDKDKNTTKKMRDSNHMKLADFFDCQVEDWLRELNLMRNEITHRSSLNGFTNFVFDSGSGKVVHPQMPNGRKVDEYCEEVFNKLLILYKKVFKDFVLPKINF